MHEMGLMASMVELLTESARHNQIQKINKVKLVVGKMSMALPDALQLAFDVYKAEGLFSSEAVLEIEERETMGRCRSCGRRFPVLDNCLFVCPDCQGIDVEVISGRELYIDHYEGEDGNADDD
ncbi:MAG: hydrogenase maturation nickel metallochaperone HypA [Desulfitobacteriaceae bacterium]|nr:hydrogenase maturation nickel metallochaperone HypA [Desulfitobacteriaceae bacterium]MDI6878465.1 hydrogenase maturation nickel metallochaperone HypA [Desulfitobacteriaceae bacterium]MDI6913016.1 hydrogenase maturation nickel metallochaperone HypA [Desulfitobacteriaceae bacterium]